MHVRVRGFVGLGFCFCLLLTLLLLLLLLLTHSLTVKLDSLFSASSVINVKNDEHEGVKRRKKTNGTNTMDVMPGTRILNAESAYVMYDTRLKEYLEWKKTGAN